MKSTFTSILIALGIITGSFLLFNNSSEPDESGGNNISVVDGKQIINITAKGGYLPRVSNAKAGIPTVLNIETKNTFDCSSAIVIPALGYRGNLEYSGVKEIEVPPQKPGSSFQGTCAMGMYSFRVNFN